MQTTYTVEGMTCGHCVAAVTEEVKQIPGVTDVAVTLEDGRLVVTSTDPVAAAARSPRSATSAPDGSGSVDQIANAGLVSSPDTVVTIPSEPGSSRSRATTAAVDW